MRLVDSHGFFTNVAATGSPVNLPSAIELSQSIRILKLTLAFLSILFLTNCGSETDVTISRITNLSYLPTTRFEDEKKVLQHVANEMLSAHHHYVESYIHPQFRYHFIGFGRKQCKIQCWFSLSFESVISVEPADSATFELIISGLPAQLRFLTQLTEHDSVASYMRVPDDNFEIYTAFRAPHLYRNRSRGGAPGQSLTGTSEIHGIIFVDDNLYPRIFDVSDSSGVMLSGCELRILSYGNNVVTDITGVTVIAGDHDFSWILSKASAVGRMLAEIELKRLYTESALYRKSLADERLRPFAQEIARRLAADSMGGARYPAWQYEDDLRSLQDSVVRYDIDSEFASAIMMDASRGIPAGFLIWSYTSYWGFTIQWILAGLLVLILYSAVLALLRKYYSPSVKLYLNSFPYIIITVNSWAFLVRPQNLPVMYWTIPGCLLVSALLYWLLKHRVKLSKDGELS